ncbi:TPA: hypothetical protein G8O10_003214 [Salmonella enterica]|nr:hypothetical protein [Salmonella enterica]
MLTFTKKDNQTNASVDLHHKKNTFIFFHPKNLSLSMVICAKQTEQKITKSQISKILN